MNTASVIHKLYPQVVRTVGDEAFDIDGNLVAVDTALVAKHVAALEQIASIEATITPRRVRESVQGTDGGWLAARDAEIAAIRASM